jgi:hypothetical protein
MEKEKESLARGTLSMPVIDKIRETKNPDRVLCVDPIGNGKMMQRERDHYFKTESDILLSGMPLNCEQKMVKEQEEKMSRSPNGGSIFHRRRATLTLTQGKTKLHLRATCTYLCLKHDLHSCRTHLLLIILASCYTHATNIASRNIANCNRGSAERIDEALCRLFQEIEVNGCKCPYLIPHKRCDHKRERSRPTTHVLDFLGDGQLRP